MNTVPHSDNGSPETVLVIGGGIAGLAAARELSRKGRDVLLLEARPHLGGRILTKQLAGETHVELGAEFVHGKSPALWRLFHNIPLAIREASDRHLLGHADGSLVPYPFQETLQQVFSAIHREGPDQSVAQFLAQHSFPSELRRNAIDYVEGFHAADPTRFSMKALAAAEKSAERLQGDRNFRIAGGYGRLVRWFEEELRDSGVTMVLNAEVKTICWRQGFASVEALVNGNLESFAANAVVITLPLGVLKADSVRFEPPLPEKQRALASVETGHVTKVVLRFRESFWPEQFGFVHTFDEWLPTWWTNEDPFTLTAWAGGPRGERGAQARCEFLMERAVTVLAGIFSRSPEYVRARMEEVHTHNWHDDPFARMAYSYVPVGELDAPRRLAAPVADTLFFAGEATDTDNQNGTVHGALNSGVRAAQELARAGVSGPLITSASV